MINTFILLGNEYNQKYRETQRYIRKVSGSNPDTFGYKTFHRLMSIERSFFNKSSFQLFSGSEFYNYVIDSRCESGDIAILTGGMSL